jgi:Integrase core domain
MQDEFYSVAFRKKLYSSLEQLQNDLDAWLEEYNQRRPHSGKYCFGKTPVQTFLDSRQLAHDKQLDRFPIVSSSDSHSRAERATSVA